MIGVQDVGVLVGDELEVPVLGVAQRGQIVRRGDVQADRVVRERAGGAVRGVGLIGEEELAGELVAEPPAWPAPGVASVVIRPKVPALPVATPGLPGRKLLVALNTSARTWML